MSSRTHRAFTLVELLVVIAIIGILMAMVLPAIQSAREASRKTECRNNIRNLAQACSSHLEGHRFYPSGGWGWGWAGDPDRGFGMRQCGGWMYSILPYIEESALHSMGKGQGDAAKRAIGKERVATPIKLFSCPTRRRPEQLPYIHNSPYYNIDIQKGDMIARSDYAANGGDNGFSEKAKGPSSAPTTKVSADFVKAFSAPNRNSTGIVSTVSQWNDGHVKDGLSKTYMVGERFLHVSTYDTGSPGDDDQGWDVGYDWDTVRWTNLPPNFDEDPKDLPNGFENFGSIHLGSFNMAMCDGSIKGVTYEIDATVHRQCGNRNDDGPDDLTGIE